MEQPSQTILQIAAFLVSGMALVGILFCLFKCCETENEDGTKSCCGMKVYDGDGPGGGDASGFGGDCGGCGGGDC